jgi:hypothetical protein
VSLIHSPCLPISTAGFFVKGNLFLFLILSTPLFSFDEFNRVDKGSSVQGNSYEQCLAGCYQNSNNIKACVESALKGICSSPIPRSNSTNYVEEPEIVQNSPGNSQKKLDAYLIPSVVPGDPFPGIKLPNKVEEKAPSEGLRPCDFPGCSIPTCKAGESCH